MPYWVLGWDVFCWLGHRRFARHWSVPQIRAELSDRFAIPLSVDAIERYVSRYQLMLAARQQDPIEVARAYRRAKGLILTIDGLQPEKGHESSFSLTLFFASWAQRGLVVRCKMFLASGPCSSECC